MGHGLGAETDRGLAGIVMDSPLLQPTTQLTGARSLKTVNPYILWGPRQPSPAFLSAVELMGTP